MFWFKKKEKNFYWQFRVEFKEIWKDIFFIYRNFIHWTLSKIIISAWGIALWVLVMIPFLLLMFIFGLIDPINWLSIFSKEVNSQDVLLWALAWNPFWFITMIFLFVVLMLAFVFATNYYIFLLAKMYFYSVRWKLLNYKKNLYFSKHYITKFFAILSWIVMYLLAPAIIVVGWVFFLYYLLNIGVISVSLFSIFLFIFIVLFVITEFYLFYRIIFSYIILAFEKKENTEKKSLSYIKESISLTWGKSIIKFVFILVVYAFILLPIQTIQDSLNTASYNMSTAVAYKSELIENIEAEDVKYFEYITKKYKSNTSEELLDKISLYTKLSFFVYFLRYFLFGGIGVLLLSSFYYHVLLRKK